MNGPSAVKPGRMNPELTKESDPIAIIQENVMSGIIH